MIETAPSSSEYTNQDSSQAKLNKSNVLGKHAKLINKIPLQNESIVSQTLMNDTEIFHNQKGSFPHSTSRKQMTSIEPKTASSSQAKLYYGGRRAKNLHGISSKLDKIRLKNQF